MLADSTTLEELNQSEPSEGNKVNQSETLAPKKCNPDRGSTP